VDDKEKECCLVVESSPLTDTLMDCYIHKDYHATPILKEHILVLAGQCDDHPISVFACREEVSRHKGDVSSSGRDLPVQVSLSNSVQSIIEVPAIHAPMQNSSIPPMTAPTVDV
jgi:hypothetical protein